MIIVITTTNGNAIEFPNATYFEVNNSELFVGAPGNGHGLFAKGEWSYVVDEDKRAEAADQEDSEVKFIPADQPDLLTAILLLAQIRPDEVKEVRFTTTTMVVTPVEGDEKVFPFLAPWALPELMRKGLDQASPAN